jgi:hypothetical protein
MGEREGHGRVGWLPPFSVGQKETRLLVTSLPRMGWGKEDPPGVPSFAAAEQGWWRQGPA